MSNKIDPHNIVIKNILEDKSREHNANGERRTDEHNAAGVREDDNHQVIRPQVKENAGGNDQQKDDELKALKGELEKLKKDREFSEFVLRFLHL